MKKYRWGIISTANIGRISMLPALINSEFAEVVAVASRNLEKAHRFAKEFGIAKTYGNYNQLLADENIDIVYIPLPNHLHKDWAIKAAEAGKHILCEKPLAITADEAREMKAAAQANGVQLQEAFMYRHHPRIKAAVEMVHSGRIGSIRTIEASLAFMISDKSNIRYQPELGGGALLDAGCYCVNFSRLMTRREPVSVQARAVWGKSGVDERMVGILDFGDGTLVHFDCGINLVSRQKFTIAGSEGNLEIPIPFNAGMEERVLIENRLESSEPVEHRFKPIDQFRLMAEDFMNVVKTGRVLYPVDDAIANMRVIEALQNSAKNEGSLITL
jgi:predicted dehydrogenase